MRGTSWATYFGWYMFKWKGPTAPGTQSGGCQSRRSSPAQNPRPDPVTTMTLQVSSRPSVSSSS